MILATRGCALSTLTGYRYNDFRLFFGADAKCPAEPTADNAMNYLTNLFLDTISSIPNTQQENVFVRHSTAVDRHNMAFIMDGIEAFITLGGGATRLNGVAR